MQLSYCFVGHGQLETAARQALEPKPGVPERPDDALFGLHPRLHDILLDAVNGPLRDRGAPCELGLAPS